MSAAWLRSVLVAGIALAWSLPAQAQTTISITCRCVTNGVNKGLAQTITDVVIPGFEKKKAAEGQPVKVEFIQFSGTDEALKEQYALDLSVGKGADILGFDGFWIPEFVSAQLLKPLDAVGGADVAKWDGWNHIPQGLQELMMLGGKRYGIALGTDARMIFYRKDMLAKAGVPDADKWQPKSWAEVVATAKAVKKAFPDSAPLQINAGTAMGEATTMQGFFMVLLGTGQGLVDENGKWIVSSPGLLKALEFYKQIYVDEKVGDARVQLVKDGRNKSFANFRDGKTAMLVESDWFYRSPTAPGSEFAVPDRDSVMGWAKMPAMEPGKGLRGQDFVTISGGAGFVLNPNSKAGKLAWELLAYMNGKEALEAAQKIEPRVRVRDDVPVPGNAFLNATSSVLLPMTTARPISETYPKVSFEAQLMTERVVSGEMSPADAMAAYKKAVIEIAGAANTVELN